MGDDPPGREAGLEAVWAQEAHYCWFVDSFQVYPGGASWGADKDDGRRGS